MEALNIDDKCHVHWREGTLLLEAVVVERRPVGAKQKKKKQKTIVAAAATTPNPAAANAAKSEESTKPAAASAAVEATVVTSTAEAAQTTTNTTALQRPSPGAPVSADSNSNSADVASTTSQVGQEPSSSSTAADVEEQQHQLAKENDVTNANANNSTDTEQQQLQVPLIDAHDMEYYVHYVGHDRRLDEWLTLDSFELSTLQRAEPKVETKEAAQQQQQDATSMDTGSGDNGDMADAASADGETAESSVSDRARRRRSSASGCHPTYQDNNNDNDTTTFSMSGGNWHGGRSSRGGGSGSGAGGGSSADNELAAYDKEHEETVKVKNIEKIVMGEWEVEAWYYSPFPSPYSGLKTLYVCEYCLSYMRKVRTFREHRKCCAHRHPPGREIYREGDLAVYELDGKDHRAYCQKLCLLAKLFLDHKTLYYDVNPFFFYVVCVVDEKGAHIAGYFSKEKVSAEGNNLACILTFPQFQQSGYGKFIISLSYELTKLEGKTGSPEKPLSDLGKLSYRSYWTYVLMNLFKNHDTSDHGNMTKDISIGSMSRETGIRTDDLISTLQSLDMLKVWKGQHVVYVEQAKIREYMDQKKKFRLCNPEYLSWTPPSKRSESAADNKNN